MPLSQDDVLQIFRDVGAVMEGHFILSSGLHSPVFLQKALVYNAPDKTNLLCKALADKIHAAGWDEGLGCVVGPAVGGIIPAFATASFLGKPFLWVERENSIFSLRRGFNVSQGEKVVIVEDIITTGLSVRETLVCLRDAGADVVGCACLIDRSGGKAHLDVPVLSLADYEVPTYKKDELPEDLKKIPAVKPGSRGLK